LASLKLSRELQFLAVACRVQRLPAAWCHSESDERPGPNFTPARIPNAMGATSDSRCQAQLGGGFGFPFKRVQATFMAQPTTRLVRWSASICVLLESCAVPVFPRLGVGLLHGKPPVRRSTMAAASSNMSVVCFGLSEILDGRYRRASERSILGVCRRAALTSCQTFSKGSFLVGIVSPIPSTIGGCYLAWGTP
jgi:hypothetical protein